MTEVDLYVDPCCPFAWTAYRWLVQVRRQRRIVLIVRLMSLAMLNEHRAIAADYRELLGHTVGPGRVAAAVRHQHGDAALVRLYEAVAQRVFDTGADHYVAIRHRMPAIVAESLAACGLPAGLATAAVGTEYDPLLRASHDEALADLADGVGTPIVRLTGNAFFGPVLSTVPVRAQGLRLFEGLLLLAGCHGLVEIKRPIAAAISGGTA